MAGRIACRRNPHHRPAGRGTGLHFAENRAGSKAQMPRADQTRTTRSADRGAGLHFVPDGSGGCSNRIVAPSFEAHAENRAGSGGGICRQDRLPQKPAPSACGPRNGSTFCRESTGVWRHKFPSPTKPARLDLRIEVQVYILSVMGRVYVLLGIRREGRISVCGPISSLSHSQVLTTSSTSRSRLG